jgi:chloramphenicol O-acetyltransferase
MHFDVYLYTNASQPGLPPEGVFNLGLLPKLDFTSWSNHTRTSLKELANIFVSA